MKKLYSIIVAFILVISIALPYKVEAKQVFSDVPVTHANYADIMYLLEKGVIQESSKYGYGHSNSRGSSSHDCEGSWIRWGDTY